ncbi:hypothetical protein GIB67_041638 [Kingdonia uniflora]|uniref:RNase H type-1 domain-containing protein n=1 Tax=Kingdonia uniflora TaxID=39325 RepID=A0A7J7MQS5_9MAGN|nr:hypothetical protein GIB67_041638 [Kingdonia uniflora]
MRVIFWNIRGIAKKKSLLSLQRLVKLYGTQIIFIAEPKIRPTNFFHGLSNFNNSIISNDCDARIGNLWCMWSKEISAPSLVSSSYQHISVLCDGAIISTVHASAFKIVRRGLWKDLIDVSKLNLPWLALGYFNIIRLQSERFGGTGPTLSAIKVFNDSLDECELIESPSVGMKLTWCNGQSGGARISRRLDRALYNGMWAGKYDGWWKVKALARENSDHSALVGEPNPIPKPKNIPFRFLKCWIELPSFQDLIKTSWGAAQAGNPIIKLMKKLQKLKTKIKQWRKAATGGLAVNISRCSEPLENLHTLLEFSDDETLIKEADYMEEELNKLLATENSIWRQKARAQWLVDGERDSAYFHALHKIKKNKNNITEVVREDGTSITDLKEIQSLIGLETSYARSIHSSECARSHPKQEPKGLVEQIYALQSCSSKGQILLMESLPQCAGYGGLLETSRTHYHIQMSLCKQQSETIQHLIWDCDVVDTLWQWLLDLFQIYNCPHNIKEMLEMGDRMSLYIKDLWRAAVIHLSQLIWLARNSVIFKEERFFGNKIKVQLLALIKEAPSLSDNWMNNTVLDLQIFSKLGVHVRARPLPCIASCRWKFPWLEEVKINCNSSTFGNLGKAGLGLIARNHSGDVLGVRTKGLGVLCRPEAECYAMLEAMIWATEMGWQKIWIEADYDASVRSFNNNAVPWKLRNKWAGLQNCFTSLRISFIWKEGNFFVAQAAKKGIFLPCHGKEDFVGTPSFISSLEDPLIEYFRIS